jgi:lipopolysaccharide transport system ATP-binding protein
VKRYSSGMYVRLAFAVAAHLDAEVLLVDEVLAVGDVSFQRKCLGKMQSIAGSGRTVLFVSHNLAAVTALCSRAIRLREGHVVSDGAPAEIVNAYVAEYFQSAHERDFPPNPAQKMQIRKVACDGTRVGDHGPLLRTQPFAIRVTYDVNEPTTEPEIALTVERSDGSPVCQTRDVDTDAHQEAVRAPGQYTATVTFPGGLLNAGTYVVRVAIERSGGWERYDYQDGIALELYDLDGDVRMQSRGQTRPGVLGLALPWQTVQISDAKAPASLSESLA